MSERNLCHESGCPDLCCANKFMDVSARELTHSFPRAVYLRPNEDVRDYFGGNYVLSHNKRSNTFFIHIRGKCDNNRNGCTAKIKPKACKNFPFGGYDCNIIRTKHNLHAINAGKPSESQFVEKPKRNSFLSKFLTTISRSG